MTQDRRGQRRARPELRAVDGTVPPVGKTTQKRSDWDAHRELVRAANRARHRARRLLELAFPGEFLRLYTETGAVEDPVVHPKGAAPWTDEDYGWAVAGLVAGVLQGFGMTEGLRKAHALLDQAIEAEGDGSD